MLRNVRDTAPKDSKYLLELSSSTNLLVPWCSFCIYLAPSVNVGIFMCKPLYVTKVLEEMQNIKNDIACLFFPFVFFHISFHMLCCVKENRILQFFFFCFLFSTRKIKKKEKKNGSVTQVFVLHEASCWSRIPVCDWLCAGAWKTHSRDVALTNRSPGDMLKSGICSAGWEFINQIQNAF